MIDQLLSVILDPLRLLDILIDVSARNTRCSPGCR